MVPHSVDMEDIEAEDEEEIFAQECRNIRDAYLGAAGALPPVNVPDDRELPFGQGVLSAEDIDLSHLVKLRTKHQTRHAAEGVRTRSANNEQNVETSARRQLLQEFHAIFKAQQERSASTGRERTSRWCESGDGQYASGNSANAAVVSQAAAEEVSVCGLQVPYSHLGGMALQAVRRRLEVIRQAAIPQTLHECIHHARISQVRPLRIADHGIIYLPSGITIAKGMLLRLANIWHSPSVL